MLAAFTELKNAEKVKQFLQKKNVLHHGYLPLKKFGKIYFPMTKKIKVPSAEVVDTKFKLEQKPTSLSLEDLLEGKLTKNQIAKIPSSQEIVGSILILEIPAELESKEEEITQAYLQFHKDHIITVVKKTQMHSGVYRTRKVKILAGKRSKETIHKENGVKIKLHLEKSYFSARSANERLRLAKQVKDGESVLVMFSGSAPFPLVIAKNANPAIVYGIELNPLAHQYALQNVSRNKLEKKITILEGDVREVVPKLKKKFDRIAMPLPKTSEEFLYVALPKAKKGAVIHLYAFLDEKEIDSEAKRVKEMCKTLKHPVRVLRKVKCGQFSPGTFRVCFDLKVI